MSGTVRAKSARSSPGLRGFVCGFSPAGDMAGTLPAASLASCTCAARVWRSM